MKWAEFISGHLNLIQGPHKSLLLWGAGKKKMRNLGTVQVPTEAFMAVLKLDSDRYTLIAQMALRHLGEPISHSGRYMI